MESQYSDTFDRLECNEKSVDLARVARLKSKRNKGNETRRKQCELTRSTDSPSRVPFPQFVQQFRHSR